TPTSTSSPSTGTAASSTTSGTSAGEASRRALGAGGAGPSWAGLAPRTTPGQPHRSGGAATRCAYKVCAPHRTFGSLLVWLGRGVGDGGPDPLNPSPRPQRPLVL